MANWDRAGAAILARPVDRARLAAAAAAVGARRAGAARRSSAWRGRFGAARSLSGLSARRSPSGPPCSRGALSGGGSRRGGPPSRRSPRPGCRPGRLRPRRHELGAFAPLPAKLPGFDRCTGSVGGSALTPDVARPPRRAAPPSVAAGSTRVRSGWISRLGCRLACRLGLGRAPDSRRGRSASVSTASDGDFVGSAAPRLRDGSRGAGSPEDLAPELPAAGARRGPSRLRRRSSTGLASPASRFRRARTRRRGGGAPERAAS